MPVFTCFIQYEVDPAKREQFKDYARTWMALIRKYGGTHHGYFIPGDEEDALPNPAFSFPGLGSEGPSNTAIALFSFPNVDAYDKYRRDVAKDEDCVAVTARFHESKCFKRYERTFLVPVVP
jgi:NIPSNAP protein